MKRVGAIIVVMLSGCTRSPEPAPDASAKRIDSVVPAEPPASPPVSARAALQRADAPIASFWAWWSKLDLETRLQIATGENTAMVEALSWQVADIHPDLAWEFGPGTTSEHALTLSGEGDAVVRIVAERWAKAAPAADASWSFFTTRQAMSEAALAAGSLTYDGVPLALAETRVGTERESLRPRLGVSIWHPGFSQLPEASRSGAAFILLDQALGEASTERWIGNVAIASSEPGDAITLVQLRTTVDTLATETQKESFALAEGTDPETKAPLLWSLDVVVSRWDHPFHDTWCDVALSYAPRANGMPTKEDLSAMYTMQEDLEKQLGTWAVFVGTQTGMGKRHMWFFVDGGTEAVDKSRAWSARQDRETTVEAAFDPGWERLPL